MGIFFIVPQQEMQQDRLNHILEMLKTNPEDSFLNYAIALEFKKNHKIDNAITILENLINKNPDYLASYYQLGKLFEETNEIDKAIQIYKTGIVVAKTKGELKTLGELSEALMILIDES